MTNRSVLILSTLGLLWCASSGAQRPSGTKEEERARADVLDLARQMRVAIETREVDVEVEVPA